MSPVSEIQNWKTKHNWGNVLILSVAVLVVILLALVGVLFYQDSKSKSAIEDLAAANKSNEDVVEVLCRNKPNNPTCKQAEKIPDTKELVRGIPGAPGPQGIQGIQGIVGPQGEPGAPGKNGPRGPQGVEGKQGSPGPEGAQGSTGETGAEGPAGPVGPQGPSGPQGGTGPQGETGQQGPAGTDAPVITAFRILENDSGDCRLFIDFDKAPTMSVDIPENFCTGPEVP